MKHTIRLTTTGRRSRRPREVTLYAFDDADRLVIVGSRGGAAQDPAWVANLREKPEAILKRGRQQQPVRTTEVTGDERDRLWRLVVREFPLYEAYRKRTSRTIPLFLLEPDGR